MLCKLFTSKHKQNNMGEIELVANSRMYVSDQIKKPHHGMGMYIWKDGEFYIGNFSYGKKDGKGFTQYVNGDTYCGYYKDGRICRA